MWQQTLRGFNSDKYAKCIDKISSEEVFFVLRESVKGLVQCDFSDKKIVTSVFDTYEMKKYEKLYYRYLISA